MARLSPAVSASGFFPWPWEQAPACLPTADENISPISSCSSVVCDFWRDFFECYVRHRGEAGGGQLGCKSEVCSLWLVELSYPLCMCVIIRGSRKECQETHFISTFIIISAVQATQNKCLAFPEIAIDSAADFTRPINNSFLCSPLPQCIFICDQAFCSSCAF